MHFEQIEPNKILRCLTYLALAVITTGCGSNSKQAILPTTQLTEEQKAAVKADDSRVDEEESQGNFNKRKR